MPLKYEPYQAKELEGLSSALRTSNSQKDTCSLLQHLKDDQRPKGRGRMQGIPRSPWGHPNGKCAGFS